MANLNMNISGKIKKDHHVKFHIRGESRYRYDAYIVPIQYREDYNLDVMVYATSHPKDDAWYFEQIEKFGLIKGVKY